MDNFIEIKKTEIDGSEVNSVDSRALYTKLGLANGQYSRWINKNLIDDDLFIENEDYIGVRLNVEGNQILTCILTMDTAKHLSMMSKSKKGKEVRDYFISIEKEANKPMTIEQLLENNVKVIKQLKNNEVKLVSQITEMKPKVLFADSVAQSQGSILIGEFAKLISDDNFKIGQNKLFAWFRNNGFLCSSGSKYNQPMQKYVSNGYFEVIERTINNPDGSTRITITTKVTGLGQVRLTTKIKGLINE